MKIVFMGTPDFAATVLAALLGSRHEVALVFTQLDRAAARRFSARPSRSFPPRSRSRFCSRKD